MYISVLYRDQIRLWIFIVRASVNIKILTKT